MASCLALMEGIVPLTGTLAVPLEENWYQYYFNIIDGGMFSLNLTGNSIHVAIESPGTVAFLYNTTITYNFNSSGIWNVQFDSNWDTITGVTLTSALPSNRIYMGTVAQTQEYTITASSDAHSAISPSGTVTVLAGNSQEFDFSANYGYSIIQVVVDGSNVSLTSPYTFTNVNANHTISVYSTVITYTITATSDSHSSISPSGNVTVNEGNNQSFSISANSGYNISQVLVDSVNQGAISNYTFTNVQANHTISVSTSNITFTITASAGSGGSISPSGNVSVAYNGSQAFTVSPNTGYVVSSVLVDGADQGAISSYTFTYILANHTIAASFAVENFAISASSDSHSTITPSGNVTVVAGNNQTFTMTASGGYSISQVAVDGVNQGSLSNYTFTNVQANHTISVTATNVTYTITATAGSNGSISPSGNVTVAYNGTQTFTIARNSGYAVSSVLVDGTDQGAISTYTFTNVLANHTISATFAVQNFTITASSDSGSSITPSGSVSVTYGNNQSFTISPNSGYSIAHVYVDTVDQGAIASYTFTTVTSSHTISVTSTSSSSSGSPGGPGGTSWTSSSVVVGSLHVTVMKGSTVVAYLNVSWSGSTTLRLTGFTATDSSGYLWINVTLETFRSLTTSGSASIILSVYASSNAETGDMQVPFTASAVTADGMIHTFGGDITVSIVPASILNSLPWYTWPLIIIVIAILVAAALVRRR
jgi:hypothetical protein